MNQYNTTTKSGGRGPIGQHPRKKPSPRRQNKNAQSKKNPKKKGQKPSHKNGKKNSPKDQKEK